MTPPEGSWRSAPVQCWFCLARSGQPNLHAMVPPASVLSWHHSSNCPPLAYTRVAKCVQGCVLQQSGLWCSIAPLLIDFVHAMQERVNLHVHLLGLCHVLAKP